MAQPNAEQINTIVTSLSWALIARVLLHFYDRYIKYRHKLDIFGLAATITALAATTLTLVAYVFNDIDCDLRSYFGTANYAVSYTLLYIHFLFKSRLVASRRERWSPLQYTAIVATIWFLATSLCFAVLTSTFRTEEGVCQNQQDDALLIVLGTSLVTNNLVLTLCFVIPLRRLAAERVGNFRQQDQHHQAVKASRATIHYVLVRRVSLACFISGLTSGILYLLVYMRVLGRYTLMFFYAEWAVTLWAASFSLPLPRPRTGYASGDSLSWSSSQYPRETFASRQWESSSLYRRTYDGCESGMNESRWANWDSRKPEILDPSRSVSRP